MSTTRSSRAAAAASSKAAAAASSTTTSVALDANGFLPGSKEANWKLLKDKGNWFTFLDQEDIKEAEKQGKFSLLLILSESICTDTRFRSHPWEP